MGYRLIELCAPAVNMEIFVSFVQKNGKEIEKIIVVMNNAKQPNY